MEIIGLCFLILFLGSLLLVFVRAERKQRERYFAMLDAKKFAYESIGNYYDELYFGLMERD